MTNLIKKATKRIGRAFGFSEVYDSNKNLVEMISRLSGEVEKLKQQIDGINEGVKRLSDDEQYATELLKRTHDITMVPQARGDELMLQKANLILLNKIIEVLNRNKIDYFLDFGILIGIQRHGGFIPWDDDIDIAVPRVSFERLEELFSEAFRGTGLHFVNSEIMRVYYKDTPLQVDIFPFDFCSTRLNDAEKHKIKQRVIRYQEKLRYDWNALFSQECVTVFSHDEMRKLYHEIVCEKDISFESARKNHSTIIHSPESPRGERTYIIDYDLIYPLKKAKVLDSEYNIPNNIEELLHLYYGDYYRYPSDIHHKHEDIDKRKSPDTVAEIRKIVRGGRIG